MVIKFYPNLKECVETRARKRYQFLLRAALDNPEADAQVEKKLSLLKHFLENTDFAALRAETEAWLTAGKKVCVSIDGKEECPRVSISVSG